MSTAYFTRSTLTTATINSDNNDNNDNNNNSSFSLRLALIIRLTTRLRILFLNNTNQNDDDISTIQKLTTADGNI